MPPQGIPKLSNSELLSLEHYARLAAWLCERVGIERIKLTGGEPLVRRGIEELVALLGGIPRLREISLTTNGALLAQNALALKAAGLSRVTVSLDSLDARRYSELTRGGDLHRTLRGIEAALQAGLLPLKLNCVLQRSTWRDEVPLLLDYAAANRLELRFIELMHTGTERAWCGAEYISAGDVRDWLAGQTSLLPVLTDASAPARLTEVAWNGRTVAVGWITPRSQPFCDCCDRLRLDARGRIHRCLMDRNFFDLAAIWQQFGSDAAQQALLAYIAGKTAPSVMEKPDAMIVIGG